MLVTTATLAEALAKKPGHCEGGPTRGQTLRRKHWIVALAASLPMLASSSAHGEGTETAAAQALFDQAKKLVASTTSRRHAPSSRRAATRSRTRHFAQSGRLLLQHRSDGERVSLSSRRRRRPSARGRRIARQWRAIKQRQVTS